MKPVLSSRRTDDQSSPRALSIALCSDFFYPRLGGVEMHIWSLAQGLIELGHRVIVITNLYNGRKNPSTSGTTCPHIAAETKRGLSSMDGTWGSPLHYDTYFSGDGKNKSEPMWRGGVRWMAGGLKVYYLPLVPIYDQVVFPTYFSHLPIFRSIMLRECIDIVHCHAASSVFSTECLLLAQTMNLRTVFTDHSLFSIGHDFACLCINKYLESSLINVDRCIAVSSICKENLAIRANVLPDDIVVIPNAVEAEKFYPKPQYRNLFPDFCMNPSARHVTTTTSPALGAMGFETEPGGSEGGVSMQSQKDRSPNVDSSRGNVISDPIHERTALASCEDGASLPFNKLFSMLNKISSQGTSAAAHSPNHIAEMSTRTRRRAMLPPPPPYTLRFQHITNPLTVIVLSRLVYRKGIDLVAAVLPVMCKMFPNVTFLIGGEGPKRLLLEELREQYNLHDQVLLAGAISQADVPMFLSHGHIFLNCSLTESFCIALLEAAAAGLYCVSTDVGGIPGVLPSSCVTLASAEPVAIIEALSEALLRVNEGKVCPYRIHDQVKDLYRWKKVAEVTTMEYNRVLALPPRPMYERFFNYLQLGSVYGIIVAVLLALLQLMVYGLEIIQPGSNIETVYEHHLHMKERAKAQELQNGFSLLPELVTKAAAEVASEGTTTIFRDSTKIRPNLRKRIR